MTVLAVLLYLVLCVGGLAAQLAFVFREYARLSSRDAIAIDQLYVRAERYFGLSFRAKVRAWLARADSHDDYHRRVQTIQKGRERITVVPELSPQPGEVCHDIVVADSLRSADDCSFLREMYIAGECEVGRRNVLQAVAADGEIRLGEATKVLRWVDGEGIVTLDSRCAVNGRVTSRARVDIGPGANVRSAYAPTVATNPNGRPNLPGAHPAPVTLNGELERWSRAGIDTRRLRRLSADCVVYNGNLVLPRALVASKLIVRGNLTVAPWSTLADDVKATGRVNVGVGSQCSGHLVADHDVHLGSGVTFSGVVYSRRNVQLDDAVEGQANRGAVVVYAAQTVTVGAGVRVEGKIAAGERVVART